MKVEVVMRTETETKNIGFNIEISKEGYTSPEKRQKILDSTKMEYQKLLNLLDNAPRQLPKIRNKIGLK